MFGDRIDAASAERLAAQDAVDAEPAAAPGAETRHGDARVVRAAGMKAAARAEQRAQPAFVSTQQRNEDARHSIDSATLGGKAFGKEYAPATLKTGKAALPRKPSLTCLRAWPKASTPSRA